MWHRWLCRLCLVIGAIAVDRTCCDALAQPDRRMPLDAIHGLMGKRGVVSDAEVLAAEISGPSGRKPSDEDRVRSLALFGKGRLLFQQEKYAEALACYQRAWQWNQESGALLWEIVPLSFHLKRSESAIEYALLANEIAPRDPGLMHQVAMAMSGELEIERVMAMVDKAIELASVKEDQQLVKMHFDRALLCFEYDQPDALPSIRFVDKALQSPEEYDTDELIMLLADPQIVYSVLAEGYLASGKFEDAERIFRSLHEATSDSASLKFHQAKLAAAKQDWDQSLRFLKAYFSEKSQSAGREPYQLLRTIAEKKFPKETFEKKFAKELEKLLNRHPENLYLTDFLAEFYLEHDKFSDTIQLLEPVLAEGIPLSGYRNLFSAYEQTSNAMGIVGLLGKGVDVTGNLLIFDQSIDQLLKDKSLTRKVVDSGVRRLEDRRRPMVASEALGVGLFCLRADKLETARRFLQFAIDNTDDSELVATYQVDWAEQCFAKEHYGDASDLFRQALENPTDSLNIQSTTEVLAMCQELDGQTDAALETLNDYLARSDASPSILLRKAWVLFHSGEPEKAIPIYEKVVDDFDDDYDTIFVRDAVREARITLSSLYIDQDDFEAAQEALLRVLDEYPNDIGAKNDLGYLWADADVRLERALEMIEQAVKAEPDNGAYLDSLGWVHFRLGNAQLALEHLQKAVENLDDPDGIILDHLGDALAAVGDSQKAKERWHEALRSLESDDRTKSVSDLSRIQAITSKIAQHTTNVESVGNSSE